MDLETNPGKTISKTTPLGWLLATAFLAATLAAAVRSFFHPGDSAVCAMDATSLLTGTAFFLHGSTRQLPFQNLLAAFVFVYLSFWIPALLGLLPAFPFGPFSGSFLKLARLADPQVWFAPCLGTLVLLASHGCTRCVLRSYRRSPSFGVQALLIGGTSSLVWFGALSALCSQPALLTSWFRVVINVAAALWIFCIMAIMSVLLIPKKPVPPRLIHHPLTVWIGLNFLLCSRALPGKNWIAGAFALTQVALALVLIARVRKDQLQS